MLVYDSKIDILPLNQLGFGKDNLRFSFKSNL